MTEIISLISGIGRDRRKQATKGGDSVKDAGFGCDAERERTKSPTRLCGKMRILSSTLTDRRSSLWLRDGCSQVTFLKNTFIP